MSRGGYRAGAGRKPSRVLISLDLHYSRHLSALSSTLAQALHRRTPLASDEVVALLIEQAYSQLREMQGDTSDE